MEIILLPLLAAICIYLLIFTFTSDRNSEKKVKKRIANLSSVTDIDQVHDDVMREKRKNMKDKKSKKFISKKFEDDLVMSGIKLNAKEYLMAWMGTTFIPILLLLLLNKSIITIIGAGIVGFIIPPFLVQRSKKKRQQLFNTQLSETLIVMGNSIKSGYSFMQAMESVAMDMQPPISTEFKNVLREMRFGVKLEDALDHMVDRTQNPDLALLVSAVVTSSQVGANLSDILDNISTTIKDRIKIREEVRVLTAQGRISGIVIGLLPVFIGLVFMLINPDYILTFFESTLGKIMLVVGLFLEIIGFLVVKKVVDVKY